jgi:hypothetical protein
MEQLEKVALPAAFFILRSITHHFFIGLTDNPLS